MRFSCQTKSLILSDSETTSSLDKVPENCEKKEGKEAKVRNCQVDGYSHLIPGVMVKALALMQICA